MAQLIKCPFHADSTASLALYSNGFYCFGCQKRGRLSELGLQDLPIEPEPEPEDLAATFRYIKALPTMVIRGIEMPYDDKGYYICWAGDAYYKLRHWDGKPKYRNPTGHEQPLYWVTRQGQPRCFVVEGELNAYSIGQTFPDWDVVSPGSAGHFKTLKNLLLKSIIDYERIIIVTDKDSAGAIACIELMGALQGKGPAVKAHLMAVDANDLLVQGTLKEELGPVVDGSLE